MRTFRKTTALLVVGLLLLALATGLWLFYLNRTFPGEDASAARSVREVAERSANLQARENHADQTVWAKETLAQHCGRVFEGLWDSLNASNHSLGIVADFPLGEITLPEWSAPEHLPHGISMLKPTAGGRTLRAEQWREQVQTLARSGWQLETIEFRHNRFDTDEKGEPQRSVFFFSAHLNHPARSERVILTGDLVVDWAAQPLEEPFPAVQAIDARGLEAKTRAGEAPFQPVLKETIAPPGTSPYIDPLILYDLNGDGLSEIILPAANLLYHRHNTDDYKSTELCRFPVHRPTTALIADFDRDGTADLLCANAHGLSLFKGSRQGTFDEPSHEVWVANPPLQNAMVLTAGDVDEDGDLDVFLGQYRVPTLGQVLRPHYYEANDGWPAHLLLNDGAGAFSDATEISGLGSNRWRRTYSASLVDLNADGHLDLAVVSDFAGLDLYQNDGHGRFAEVTRQWVGESHAFGMAHALADFDRNGRLDLLMIGMPSPTVDRMDHLGLSRSYSAEDPLMRSAMAYGNRLYLAREGRLQQTEMNESIARSGWSWGCSAFDFDNDAFVDVYIANGLESRQSVRDYEPEFWLHDIFVDEKVDDVIATRYFMEKFNRTRGAGWSYGGYEKNRLYLNRNGQSFVEVAHLAGVALEQDSRNVVTDDLDGDGRIDLLLTTLEVWPTTRQTLQVYRNRLSTTGHWIGFRFREEPGKPSPVGARVTIQYQGHSTTRHLTTGDSHRSQHANTVHFGLGAAQKVDLVKISWLNGSALTLSEQAAGRYYEVHEPSRNR